MNSNDIHKSEGCFIKEEPEWQCNDLDMTGNHLPSDEYELNTDQRPTSRDNLCPLLSGNIDGCGIQHEDDMLEGISLKRDTNTSVLKQEVGRDTDKTKQCGIVCKEEPVEVMKQVNDDISATMDGLKQGSYIKSEQLLLGVSVKEEVSCSCGNNNNEDNDVYKHESVDNKMDSNDGIIVMKGTTGIILRPHDIHVKHEASSSSQSIPAPSSSDTRDNSLHVSHKSNTRRMLPETSQGKSVKQEFMDEAESPLMISLSLLRPCFVNMYDNNVKQESPLMISSSLLRPCFVNMYDNNVKQESPLMISSSLLRRCFVNMYDNNVLYNSQQHHEEVMRISQEVLKKLRKSQNFPSTSNCAHHPDLTVHHRSDRKLHKCDICDYSTPLVSNLVRHKPTRVHNSSSNNMQEVITSKCRHAKDLLISRAHSVCIYCK